MIYELRKYKVAPGRLDELHERFKSHTLRFFCFFPSSFPSPVLYIYVSLLFCQDLYCLHGYSTSIIPIINDQFCI